ncbi:galactan 5-O-arabinofuranosyltransferase [Corynebacterium senegalense]|uniref:galactan 5-O-arabinofuranosyltransferase n=1 Tax=Corynebacterium senegalense TaxID=2080750 RepID=UPI000E205BBF|nr:galactan 5-O-arabinofuranosyltransferase [Corynebacterium senegalense]
MHVSHTETPPDPDADHRAEFRTVEYSPDALSVGATVWRSLAAAAGGALLALLGWFVLHSVSLPAFNTSMSTRALATATSFVVIVAVALLLWLWMRDADASAPRPRWRRVLTEVAATLAPSALVLTSLGLPLSATKLYLDGIQVDQGFRTQFLSRMAQQLGNHDMSYIDLPTFYPLGWFWLGGRAANLLGMPGWEVYQPWAIVSLAAAAAALTPLWQKLTSSLPVAATVALITTAVVLTQTPDEPYAAIVAMFVPAAAIASAKALTGSWPATAALAVYLGVSANFYTLYTAISALTVVVFAAVCYARKERSLTPVTHLVAIGVGSILIALISWGPYLYQVLFGGYEVRSTANHFLPTEGTVFPLPFFSLSIVGALSLAGLAFLLLRLKNTDFTGLALAIAVCYVWALGSMAASLAGTSLLGFRLEVLITLLFVTAGVLALAEARLIGIEYFYPARVGGAGKRAVTAVLTVLLAGAGLSLVQQIPKENEAHIDQAYADTDGYGERADRFPPDAAQYYAEITDFIVDHGHPQQDSVVFTDEINFMAFNPFYGFNAFTSHYANPLGEFHLRNAALQEWSAGSFAQLSEPGEFTAALDSAPWRAPDAFIFRGDLDTPDEPWKTHIAHDIFPSQPNVRYEALFFNPAAFDSPAWDVRKIGPFVVAVRNP